MADFADASGAAPSLAAKPSTSKKVAKPKKPAQPAEHPKYREMITSAIRSLKDRKGSSRQAILKHVLANNKVGSELNKINSRVKMALRAGIKSGTFKQVRGTGASGSFRLGEKLTRSADKPKTTKTAKKVVKKPALKKAKTSGKTKVAAAGTKKAVAKSKKPIGSPSQMGVVSTLCPRRMNSNVWDQEINVWNQKTQWMGPGDQCMGPGDQCIGPGDQCIRLGDQCMGPETQCMAPGDQCMGPGNQCMGPQDAFNGHRSAHWSGNE